MRITVILLILTLLAGSASAQTNPKDGTETANPDEFHSNPDGTIRILPYQKTQEKELKELIEEIADFHKQFTELLPFLKLRKKAGDTRYFDEYYKMETWEPRNPQRHFETEAIDVKYSGTALQKIVFSMEKNRLGKRTENTRVTSQVVNSQPGGGPEAIELVITESGIGPDVVRIYNMSNVRDPSQRLKIIRSYRNYIFETIQRIERMIMIEVNGGEVEVKNTLRNLK